jgi:hypothetical protein
MSRGKLGFEAFDVDDRSLGLFPPRGGWRHQRKGDVKERPTSPLAEMCCALRVPAEAQPRLHHPGGSRAKISLAALCGEPTALPSPCDGNLTDSDAPRCANAISTATPRLAQTSSRSRTQSCYPSRIAMLPSSPASARTASHPTQNSSEMCCSGCGQFGRMRTA